MDFDAKSAAMTVPIAMPAPPGRAGVDTRVAGTAGTSRQSHPDVFDFSCLAVLG
jgi:hypothetical protein